ncbi:MAG: TIGR01777 family protein [Candidatus Dactylopiibacterium carminicum]|nr:MAG: TIGR01777 family protein [Candidatus Dactylopiibacterium carminicum]
MEILITGGTGLLGRALCKALQARGDDVTVLSRHPLRVPRLCGKGVRGIGDLSEWTPARRFDAVINLAGAPIVDHAWSEARKRQLWGSRVELTQALVAVMARAEVLPAVLLSGSAVGIYGDCGELICAEDGPAQPAQDFGARLCDAWEAAALGAEALGTRVCLLRTGLVLAHEGGLLARMRPAFAMGLGMRLGDGRQWMSWIQLTDWVAGVLHLLDSTSARGPYNLCAPQPVRNADFTRTLAAALKRPAFLAAPSCALRLMLGQRAYLLLGGQRVLPERLLGEGFVFQHETVEEALRASLD